MGAKGIEMAMRPTWACRGYCRHRVGHRCQVSHDIDVEAEVVIGIKAGHRVGHDANMGTEVVMAVELAIGAELAMTST